MKKILFVAALSLLIYECFFVLIHNLIFQDDDIILSIVIAFFPLLLISIGILSYLLHKNTNINHSLLKEKSETHIKLSQSRYLFNSVIKESSIAMAVLNINGKILQFNDLFLNLFDAKQEQLLQLNFHDLLIIGGVTNYKFIIEQLKKGLLNFSSEKHEWRKENGDVVFIDIKLSMVYDRYREPIYIIVSLTNKTEQKKIEIQLDQIHHYDSLTGIPNSNGMYKVAAQLTTTNLFSKKFIVMAANIDNFKHIIGSLGYDAGDSLLKTVANRMQQSIRPGDLVSRISGDLFVLIIGNINNANMYQSVVNKIIDMIMQPVRISNQEIIVTMSAGISIHPDDGRDIKTLLKNADIALQRAKLSGKNNYQFFSQELSTITNHDLALRTALNSALLHDEFILHYQPKLDLASSHITGVEAFLRWKNRQFNDLPSGEIIQVAIDTGLILPVSDWVIRTACSQINMWEQAGLHNLSIAINCSLREIHQRNYPDKVISICNEYGIPPQLLEIEFKESDIMRDQKLILEILYKLKNKGITVVIDDYGQGQCSLTNLKRLSLDKIKIKTSLVTQIKIDDLATSIITAIIDNANKIGIKTIATQVEKKEQYEYLSNIGCKEIQGRYIFEPANTMDITNYMLNARANHHTKEERTQT